MRENSAGGSDLGPAGNREANPLGLASLGGGGTPAVSRATIRGSRLNTGFPYSQHGGSGVRGSLWTYEDAD